jgi:sugar phosphate isomerase/epimerase
MKLGAQFYSIRDNTTNPEDLKKSFAAMKAIGYGIVQMSAICEIAPELLKSYSEEYDLPITCTHSPYDRIINDTDRLIEEHKIYGCPTIGLGSMPNEFREGGKVYDFVESIREPLKKIRAAGLEFAYHNHAFEFEKIDGKLIYDILIDELPELSFIIDTYWFKYAGYDYIEYIKKLGVGRIKNVHFKDMASEPQGEICPCGEGVIDFAPVIKLCDELGIVNALVEQDNAPDSNDSIGQMRISYNNLKSLF